MIELLDAAIACDSSVPYAELPEVIKQPIEVSDPNDQNDDDNGIQDRFNLSLHRDEAVYKPQHNSCRDNCDKNCGKWHFERSNLVLVPGLLAGRHEKL